GVRDVRALRARGDDRRGGRGLPPFRAAAGLFLLARSGADGGGHGPPPRGLPRAAGGAADGKSRRAGGSGYRRRGGRRSRTGRDAGNVASRLRGPSAFLPPLGDPVRASQTFSSCRVTCVTPPGCADSGFRI